MRRRIILTLITILCYFGISTNVLADAHPVYIEGTGTDTYGLKTSYSSFKKTTVSSANTSVMLYGKSECNGSSCTITYAASQNSSYKDALANSVTCANGEKYIIYQDAGTQNHNYRSDNQSKTNGTVYWDYEFSVSCTNDSTKNDLITLKNVVEDTTTTITTNNGSNNSSNSNSNSGYTSSDPVNNEPTGVNTYFMVLSVVALISYVFMIIVKKYNLFKNI